MAETQYDYRIYREWLFTPGGSKLLSAVRDTAESMLAESGAIKGHALLKKFELKFEPETIRAAVDYLEEIQFLRRVYGSSDFHTGQRVYVKGA